MASPQMQFHLLDAAIFCGQVEAVVKLMSNQSGPVRRNMSQHVGSTPYMTTLLSTSLKNGFSEEDAKCAEKGKRSRYRTQLCMQVGLFLDLVHQPMILDCRASLDL